MKKIILLIALLTLYSCDYSHNHNNDNTASKPSLSLNDTLQSEISEIDNIEVDLDISYSYLDSLNLDYKTDTFWDILSNNDYTIVYFYPLDFTPNCTIQAIDFSIMLEDFADLWYQIVWVSRNDIESHKRFAEENSLRINLIHDKNSDLLSQFWAIWELQEFWFWDEKSDIIRSTFIVNQKWEPVYAFRDVEAVWHAMRLFEFLKNTKN